MARTKMTEEQKAEARKEANKKYYQNRRLKAAEEEGVKYSDYLADKGRTQLKLTLTPEEDKALRAYAEEHGYTPQEVLKKYIHESIMVQGDA